MRSKLALVLLGTLTVASSPAGADWLVTREGGRVETRGEWKLKGRLVVFTRTDGSLSSLRLVDVDLEASRKATAEAKVEVGKPAPPEAGKKKRTVLTDKDFRQSAAATPSPAKPAEPAPPAVTGPVAVSSWERVDLPGGDGVEIQGVLRNTTNSLVANAAVEVQLYDEAGTRVGTAAGILGSPVIQPRGTTGFRVRFPGLFFFAEAKFEVKGLPLDISPAPEQRPAETPPQ